MFGNSTQSQQQQQQQLSQQERSIIIKTQVDPIIKQNTDLIKQENIAKSKLDIEYIDRKCKYILRIAERFEELYNEWEYPFFISDICSHVSNLFQNIGLERDTNYIFQTLPDKYKNKNKNAYKNLESKLCYSQIKRNMSAIEGIDLSKLDASSIRELRKASISQVDRFQLELQNRKEPIEEEQYSQLDDLKTAEDTNFQKARISPPISTPEQLCTDPEYDSVFQKLKRELDQTVATAEAMRTLFTVEYPPLSVQSCERLTNNFANWNEFYRPYTDEKYRSDHIQSTKIAFTKVLETSTKASKESRIPCAYTLDKHGLPVMRSLTKEQIDSLYVDEINFYIKMLNTYFDTQNGMSEVFKEHKARNLADRAAALSPHLSHTA